MRILLLCCSIALVLAVANLPIGYYTFLRILVTIGAIAVVVTEFDKGVNVWVVVFGIVAILFNPLIPVYLYDKSVWMVIDLITAAIFGIKSFFFNRIPA